MFEERLVKKPISLRCVLCAYEFKKQMEFKDNITEVECPNCKRSGLCEINYGKRN